MDLFKFILFNVQAETQEALVGAILNELRYPSSKTYHFLGILCAVFEEKNYPESEKVHSVIIRTLLERLEVSEPHPWGLVILFRELVQSGKYEFGRKQFVQENRAVIQNLFETKLARFKDFFAPRVN